jgi:DNA-3-methyladenine glycosylase
MRSPSPADVVRLPAPLPRSFYDRPADVVAPALLGHMLVRNTPQGPSGGLIVETEAYLSDDPACHGFGGRTERNRAIFGPPGRAYVYLIYGMHYCVNAVCRPRGVGEAVLIRALEPTLGLELMRARRSVKRSHDLTNGPAKLCAALDIERSLDETDLCDAVSALFIDRNPNVDSTRSELGPVTRGPRIGITKAAALPLRFFLKRSAFVSRG